jgi:hypothetical protein
MILFDYSQVCIANVMVHYRDLRDDDGALSLDKFRRLVLATVRKNVLKFRAEYGRDVVIAVDSGPSWRKDYFQYYKANRKTGRDESTLDWNFIFDSMRAVKEELRDNFPYRVIEVPRAEADDVIGTIAHRFGAQLGDGEHRMLILSGDKDFIQLQTYSNVRQYAPVGMKVGYVNGGDPDEFLLEHVIRGDGGDGVPNALSADETFIKPGGRNMTLSAKRMSALKDSVRAGTCTETGYFRNLVLIDLARTPESIKEAINASFDSQGGKTRLKLMNYFIKHRLADLVQNLSDY